MTAVAAIDHPFENDGSATPVDPLVLALCSWYRSGQFGSSAPTTNIPPDVRPRNFDRIKLTAHCRTRQLTAHLCTERPARFVLVLSEAVLVIDYAWKRMKAPASTLHARIKPITRRHTDSITIPEHRAARLSTSTIRSKKRKIERQNVWHDEVCGSANGRLPNSGESGYGNCRLPNSGESGYQMGLTGIEPALPKELDPKSSASASSATAPFLGRYRLDSQSVWIPEITSRVSAAVLLRRFRRRPWEQPRPSSWRRLRRAGAPSPCTAPVPSAGLRDGSGPGPV